MHKPDDSSLDPESQRAVEERAKNILDRAAAWNRFPTPIDDILAAAKLKLAPRSIFDIQSVMAYLHGKATTVAHTLKTAISKVFGVYDSDDSVIHIDQSVSAAKQAFLKLHETGHHEMPTHRKMFRFFQDCDKTLAPDIADKFEREANNFARFALFQGNAFAKEAADLEMKIKTPMAMAKKYGASIYASAREFARTHHRMCVVYVLEPIEHIPGQAPRATVRRIEASQTFAQAFGVPRDLAIGTEHPLRKILPIGRKMTRPTMLEVVDRNGNSHECVAEAFDTTWNILILVYVVRELTSEIIIMPARTSQRI